MGCDFLELEAGLQIPPSELQIQPSDFGDKIGTFEDFLGDILGNKNYFQISFEEIFDGGKEGWSYTGSH